MTAPASIAEVVEGALVRTRLAALVEGVLLGLTAALGTAGALVLSRSEPWSVAGFVVQGVSALACAGAWWAEHWPTRAEVAGRADRRLGLDGALLAAWERERDGGGLGGLLAARVLARLPADALARAAKKPALALAAGPLAALALFLALPRPAPALPVGVPELAGKVAVALGRAQGTDGAPAELVELRTRLEAAAQGALGAEEAGEALEQAALVLEGASAQAGGADPVLLAGSDLARAALARLADTRKAPAGPSTGGKNPSESDGSGSATGFGMQNEPAARTMVGSPRGALDRATPPSSGPAPAVPPASEAGTAAGRWWPAEYDDVVAAWRELAAGRK
ncbi:MAG: hypothetical protein NTV21_01240 [Planctomycetota bacterium]|nr:hypothetical protein [Planctomycetota bacterium]